MTLCIYITFYPAVIHEFVEALYSARDADYPSLVLTGFGFTLLACRDIMLLKTTFQPWK